jgi:hypothetical protein
MGAILLVYAAGVVVGLWRADGPLLTRAALAGAWPVGVAAAAITAAVLVAAAAVLFPAVAAAASAGLLLAWWAF